MDKEAVNKALEGLTSSLAVVAGRVMTLQEDHQKKDRKISAWRRIIKSLISQRKDAEQERDEAKALLKLDNARWSYWMDEARRFEKANAALLILLQDIKYQVEQSDHPSGLGILASIAQFDTAQGEDKADE